MSDETQQEEPIDHSGVVQAAEDVLRKRFGGPVRLAVTDVLRERYRNRVLRCAVEDGPVEAPASVILKAVEGKEEHAYDPENDGGAAWRLYNEWAGNRFLDELGIAPPFSAGFVGGSRDAGLIVLEDLGKDGESLADRMQGADRATLEAALRSFAASIGRLHAATAGKEAEFMALRQEIGGKEREREREGVRWLRENVEPFRAFCDAMEVSLPAGFDEEVEWVQQAIVDPGPFLAFSPGDTCPDNHRLTDTGYVRFFDFEFAGFNHALLTAAYFYLPFPTCWCVNRLPEEIVQEMEIVYRKELSAGCAPAAEDGIFYPALLSACAFWTIATVSWDWEGLLKEDFTWGISTGRQRHLLRLENFAEGAERHALFPALGNVARRLAGTLRSRWALGEEMPLYPAFRDEEKS
jgi:hypothetical protein